MTEWDRLFGGMAGKNPPRRFQVLKKEKNPILFLPNDRRLADATLRLYPAQSLAARAAVEVARLSNHAGVQIYARSIDISIDDDSGFANFLKSLVPGSETLPHFGVLCGNIKAAGRRFTFLLFDAAGNPSVVVKAGARKEARHLVKIERDLFLPRPPAFPGMPDAIGFYEGDDASAIAYRYVDGPCPLPGESGRIAALLSSWIHKGEPVPISRLPIWSELEILQRESPSLKAVLDVVRDCPVKPVLFHGDFASWNVRVCSQKNKWVIVDWERGAHQSIPGWDWLHYVLQYDLLVKRTSPEATLSETETLWADARFIDYAQKTGIQLVIKELTFLYVLHLLRFHRPRDKADRMRRFFEEFRKRYFKNITVNNPTVKISVVTPSYKQLPWLKLCAASVADQEGVTVEHIIQDAQSGPDLDEWVQANTKAHLYVECDAGMYDAINRGFVRATGDIVCWLNSDEQYLPGTLARVADFFQKHPEIDILFGDALLVDNKGELLSYRRTVMPELRHIQSSHLNVLSCATFVRRSVLERGYYLETRWKAIADAVWIADLLKAGIPMALVNEPLSVFTITDKNLGQTSLAFSEIKLWQSETSYKATVFRSWYVLWHRINKLMGGAYRPRSISTSFYTLASPNARVLKSNPHLGFRWPRSI
jgi:glycosyltransferase involved in cell wall biosynthesis